MNYAEVESVCIFGSMARGSADALSDRDVLVVAEPGDRKNDLIHHWRNQGWTVSSFNPPQFLAMASSGSLFVEHIRREGRIELDRNGWLQSTLRLSKPKLSYKIDAMNSVNLALPIERLSNRLDLFSHPIAADIAFVSARNFLFNYLADSRKFVFSYRTAIELVTPVFRLSTNEVEILQSLRQGKALFRGNENVKDVSGTVGDVRVILSKFFPNRPISRIAKDVPVRRLGSGYATLRDFEVAVYSINCRLPNHDELVELGISDIWKWVENPKNYTSAVRGATRLVEFRIPRGIEKIHPLTPC